MQITIICDASWDPFTHAAGYGFWIASARGKLGGGGAFNNSVDDATIAELCAIGNSLAVGVKDGLIQTGDRVLVQSDCVAALNLLAGRRSPRAGQERNAADIIESRIQQYYLLMQYRHIKGHTLRDDRRSVANRLCDERAKTEMRKQRAFRQCRDNLQERNLV